MLEKDKQFIFLVIYMILGIAISIQFRTTWNQNRLKPNALYKIEELKGQIENEKNIGKNLKVLIDEKEKKKEEHLKTAVDDKNDNYLKHQLEQLNHLKLQAGLIDVKGPGVIIKLDDAPVRKSDNPNILIIHDSDIVKVLNELRGAGAQAISINGERIIPTSEQVCAGTTIRINKKRYAAPYIISAIGDSDLMYDRLNQTDAVALMLRDSIRIELSKAKEIIIPKYNHNIEDMTTELEGK